METTAIKLVMIEDHEGDGECASCGKSGLRWIAALSDGSRVGLECSKRVLGFRPTAKSYDWVADYTVAAEHVRFGDTYVLWQHKSKNVTRETRNGVLVTVGGVRSDWEGKGWI